MKNLKKKFYDVASSSNDGLVLISNPGDELAELYKDCRQTGAFIDETKLVTAIQQAPKKRYSITDNSICINVLSLKFADQQKLLEMYWMNIFPYKFYMKKGNDLSILGFKDKFAPTGFEGIEIGFEWIQFNPEAPTIKSWFAFLHHLVGPAHHAWYYDYYLEKTTLCVGIEDEIKELGHNIRLGTKDAYFTTLISGTTLDANYEEFEDMFKD